MEWIGVIIQIIRYMLLSNRKLSTDDDTFYISIKRYKLKFCEKYFKEINIKTNKNSYFKKKFSFSNLIDDKKDMVTSHLMEHSMNWSAQILGLYYEFWNCLKILFYVSNRIILIITPIQYTLSDNHDRLLFFIWEMWKLKF